MGETILIVDDDPGIRDAIEATLLSEGYRLELAQDGPTALARATSPVPDLVLLDILMPRMDGLEVCRRLKDGPMTADVPVIVLTGVVDATIKEAALISGADDLIAKPFRPDDLRARVAAMLRVRRLRQELDRTLAYLHELEAARRAEREGLRGAGSVRLEAAPAPSLAIPVLLVDDEVVSREVFGDLLVEHGFRVYAAASGPEALEIAARERLEAAIVDIRMPGMSGLTVLERLRAADPDFPVIMLTGHPTSQAAIASLKLGASDFIVKGLDHALVVLAVHRAVRIRRQLQERADEIRRLRARVVELEGKANR
ncbi:MAG: response regulator [Candidatus Methylomirabilales bacterium]